MRPILPLRFETIQTLRETTTSSTFVASDHFLGRNNVVVKAIRKGSFTEDRSSLVDVCAWYQGLRHAHISGLLDTGLTPKGDLILVRDFAPPAQLFVTRDTELLNALLGAVDFLHSAGRVHGSIKPSNVLATSGSVQLADPWIPQAWKGPSTEEEVRFCAPEVLKGGPRTIESDLYSVGALLYRFFSGRDLFDDADMESLSARYIWASPRPLTSISYVSRTIAEIVENLIHKDPAQRRSAFESLKNEFHLRSVAAVRSPVFGMTEPLKKAEQFLQAGADRLRALVVEAPAGFGKTRYIEELRLRMALQAPNLAFSVCPTVGRSPEVTVARWVLSVFERHCSSFEDPSVRRLQALVDNGGTSVPEYSSERMIHDIVDVIASIAQNANPLVLVVEDIDRANKRVGRLIEAIVSRATRVRLCIVVTSRPGGLGPKMLQTLKDYAGPALECISLGHLRDADCESIASFLERDEDRRSAACKNSGGNPLFIEEYCKNRKPGVPQLVRSTISKRVTALPKQSRGVVDVLSLFEESVHFDVLQQLVGIESQDLAQNLVYLKNLGLSDDSIAIRHTDTRAFLYSRISKKRKPALHVLCYELLKDSRTDKSSVARHAYLGGLFEVASNLFFELAKEAIQSRDYPATTRFLGVVEQCRKRSPAVLAATIEETVLLARCRGYAGDSTAAQEALRPLLSIEAVLADPELLSSVYSALASPFVEPSNTERIRLLHLATACLSSNSPTLGLRQRLLADALLRDGRVDEAETALGVRGLATDGIGRMHDASLRSMILSARGRFREAAECIASEQSEGHIGASARTNLAVCLEKLGDIRQARRIQSEGLRQVASPEVEIVCLGNLVSMETKLGNIREAQQLLEAAIAKVEYLRRGKLAVFPQGAYYSDAALHWIERGNYLNALHYIDQLIDPLDTGSAYQCEAFQLYSPQCELLLALGQLETAATVLEKTRALGSGGGFLDVERLLIQCRLQAPTDQACDDLREAIETAKRIETRYQQCRLLIALAQHLASLGKRSHSKIAANDALELAQKGGYRLLAAQAYLRRGLAAENDAQKQADLIHCLQDCSDMNLLPLLAECSFHIGDWRYSSGDYFSARDHLFRSVSITERMAEGLDSSSRKRLLSRPLHRSARRMLEEATTRAREFTSAFSSPAGKEDLFFGGLYRLTSALGVESSITSVVSTLTHSLRQWIPHAGAVILQDRKGLTFSPLEEYADEGMRHRAAHAFRTGGKRVYFSSFGEHDAQRSAGWIPIPCLSLSGGIYVECQKGHSALDEQEIQYLTVSAAIAGAALDRQGNHDRHTLTPPSDVSGIVGNSESIKRVRIDIEVAASNSATVLIEGESGTGKELVAQAIHSRSLRAKAPFVPVDCGALPDGLIESELFGTRKGAFTGAGEDRRGLFEDADHGTIFLDEIGNASQALQTKLLRVLQEREIRRVGDTKGKRIDVRLIAATNCDLERLVQEGRFRQDLLFRLKVLYIPLPPLRDRKEDIPLLANVFLNQLNALNHMSKAFGPKTAASLLMHEYPGNIRELQNVIEQSFYRCDSGIIDEVVHKPGTSNPAIDEMQSWFRELTEGRRSFWSAVHDRYKRRDISRERVVALVDLGLRSTQGNYKAVASMFKIKDTEYRRFMDFLRRNDCLLDFRPYRKMERSL